MKKYLLNASLIITIAISISSCGPSEVVVRTRPEPPVYARPMSPNSSYIWIDGEWVWSGNRYIYRNGYWAAPRGHRVWVSGRWEERRGGWRWRSGHWQ